jgi:hypothetical protein
MKIDYICNKFQKSMKKTLLLTLSIAMTSVFFAQESIQVEKTEETNGPQASPGLFTQPNGSRQVINHKTHEFNLGVGSGSYYGDLNSNSARNFVNVNWKRMHFSGSLGYKYNFKKRFSVGVQATLTHLSGADKDNNNTNPTSKDFFRYRRNLSFYTDVFELSGNFFYEPFRTKQVRSLSFLSPYAGIGLGFMAFNPKTTYNGKEIELHRVGTEGQLLPEYQKYKYRLTQVVVPLTLGAKLYLTKSRISLGAEFQYRYMFTDYLDDVSNLYVSRKDLTSGLPADQAALAVALSDRTNELFNFKEIVNTPESPRGSAKYNDAYFTFQFKLSYYLFD